MGTHRIGTTYGNVVFNRYFRDTGRLHNPTATAELAKFRALVQYFQKYGDQYDLPWPLLAAQAYQESQLDQTKTSHAGAVGVMQIKPSTAAGWRSTSPVWRPAPTRTSRPA